MRVSVVIPTYNSGPLVAEAVASALAQTRPAHEVIVIDDGSTDDTADRLAAFGRAVRYVRQKNGGVAAARNAGVRLASGEVIGFLDADDVWHPRKLGLQLAALSARPDLGMIGTGVYDWPASSHPAVTAAGGKLTEVPLDRLVVRNWFVTSTVLARAEVVRAAGEFDRTLRGPEDHDMWLRIARLSPAANLDLRLSGYRTVDGSLSKNAEQMEAGMRSILGKLEAGGVFRGRPLLRRRAWGYFRCSCGYMYQQAGNRSVAARLLALSLLAYPAPYPRADVRYSFGRLRLLAATLMGRGRPGGARTVPTTDRENRSSGSVSCPGSDPRPDQRAWV